MLFVAFQLYAQQTSLAEYKTYNAYHDEAARYQNLNLDSAQMYMDSCMMIANEMQSDYYVGKTYQLYARAKFYSNQIDSAILYGNYSMEMLKEYPDSIEYFLAEYNQGNLLLAKGNHIEALVQFKRAANIIEDNFEQYVIVDEEMVHLNRAYCYASIGIVLDDLDDYEGALESYRKSLRLSHRVESWESEVLRSAVLNNMGISYLNLNNFQQAESYAIAGMEQKKKLNQESSIGYSYQLLAKIAYERSKYDLCLRYLKESDEKFSILNNSDEMHKNDFLRAECYYRMGNYDKSMEKLKPLEEIYLTRFTKDDQAEFYELMANIYQQKGDLDTSNDYLRITLKLRKEIYLSNDKGFVTEFVDFIEDEEVQLNNRIQSLKNKQEKEKLELQIKNDREKEVWIYTLFLVSILCLIIIIMVIANAFRRNKRINADLSNSIEENKILFREVHHRVKNNFQIISSLLSLQQGIEEDERGKKVLTDAQGRIQSMSLVHEMLYRKNEVKSIDFADYTNELIGMVIGYYVEDFNQVKFSVDSNVKNMDLELAIPIGLIINEAVTNSIKYAFDSYDEAEINVSFNQNGQGKYHLLITDNGKGIPEEYLNGKIESLGIELISILSEQLGGEAKITNTDGTKIELEF
ncbi:ATP-binding protein [Paracrocinitomix mangrovi]|uniref:tetratricopeptide repeat-containing sensor histidine kinase n=1 Tax=Paracrocinitomix mangrovi TaxID=2862509 RepID=UPI001C8D70E6|nr:histidine kinase dimerization/phosphoacceptor domain -containing protein [Paracrocinitomix mangrovi]UKN02634.1 ATP-binding protein [Paracrocinitomix mangrovi]